MSRPAGSRSPHAMRFRQAIEELKSQADPKARDRMARFGIETNLALGVSVPKLRALAKRIGRDHGLALRMWDSRIHEARILASMIDEPPSVTNEQMEAWAAEFDSWDVVDHCCGNLFERTPHAWRKAVEWTEREEEFVKRAAFALMAYLAAHDTQAPDRSFGAFLPLIQREGRDGRNFVKKAVSWALRAIGKRGELLNDMAVNTATSMRETASGPARWIASDALRELRGDAVQGRLRARRPATPTRAGGLRAPGRWPEPRRSPRPHGEPLPYRDR
jgi:3-methyladenine DNA glycosylase AlkD